MFSLGIIPPALVENVRDALNSIVLRHACVRHSASIFSSMLRFRMFISGCHRFDPRLRHSTDHASFLHAQSRSAPVQSLVETWCRSRVARVVCAGRRLLPPCSVRVINFVIRVVVLNSVCRVVSCREWTRASMAAQSAAHR